MSWFKGRKDPDHFLRATWTIEAPFSSASFSARSLISRPPPSEYGRRSEPRSVFRRRVAQAPS